MAMLNNQRVTSIQAVVRILPGFLSRLQLQSAHFWQMLSEQVPTIALVMINSPVARDSSCWDKPQPWTEPYHLLLDHRMCTSSVYIYVYIDICIHAYTWTYIYCTFTYIYTPKYACFCLKKYFYMFLYYIMCNEWIGLITTLPRCRCNG